MLIPVEILKLIQAAAVVLQGHSDWRMGRMRLLKLLYIADRESLQKRARPITGDTPVAMEHGPILSLTYDLIKPSPKVNPDLLKLWQKYIWSGVRDVSLLADPGTGELSRYEIAKLKEVAERYRGKSDGVVRDYTHTFPEWIKHQPRGKTSKFIPVTEMLEAVGHAANKKEIMADAKAINAMHRLLSTFSTAD